MAAVRPDGRRSMTATRELWTALGEQARLWSRTPIASAVSAQLPRSVSQPATGVRGLLQDLYDGFGGIMTQPLTMGSVVASLMNAGMMPRQTAPPEHELKQWLDAARRVEMAHRSTVAWFRSRLPGYPLILAPQLVPGTPLTTLELTSRLIWTRDELRRGLQFQGSPAEVGSELDVRGLPARNLAESASAVSSALERTDEWADFRAAVKTLGQGGKADLRAARIRLADLLAPEAIDAHEPNLLLPRGDYRAQVTFDVVESLEGSARLYADAFANANDLIDTCASEVFGQLAMRGEPISLPATKLDLCGGRPTRVSFELGAAYAIVVDCGNVAWLDDPLVSDAIRVESTSISMDPAGGGTLKVGARILDNTGDAWREDPEDASN